MNVPRSKNIEWQLLAFPAVFVCCISIMFRHESWGVTAWYSFSSAFVVTYCLFGWEKVTGDATFIPAIVTILAAAVFLLAALFGK